MRTTRAGAIAALLAISASANATIIVDGDYMELNSLTTDSVTVLNQGRLALNDATVIAPGHTISYRNTGGIVVRGGSDPTSRSTFEMSGNSFLTSPDSVALSLGYFADARLSDHSIVAAAPGQSAIRTNSYGIPGNIYLEDYVRILGNLNVDSNLFISDNALINGGVRHSEGSTNLIMSGGHITGGVGLAEGGRYSASISGGRIDNGFVIGGSTLISKFEMSGGGIYGGIRLGEGPQSGHIFGGSVFGALRLEGNKTISIWGGSFNADPGGWLIDAYNGHVDWSHAEHEQSLAIYGGDFGSFDSGQGIRLSRGAGLDFHGYDLSFVDGVLSGYLSDGSWINLSVTTTDDWIGTINVVDVRKTVPEPTSLTLLLTALGIGIATARRRSAAECRESVLH